MAQIFAECLAQAVADKKISAETAKTYERYFNDAMKEAEQAQKGVVDSYTFATSKAAERWMAEIGRKKKEIAADILRIQREMGWIDDYRVNGKPDIFRAMQALLGVRVRGGGEAAGNGLVAQQRAAYGMFQSRLTGFINDLGSKNLGLTHDVVPARDTAATLFGRDTTPGAKINATAWRQVLAKFVEMMEAEGIHINNIEDYIVPNKHNPMAVRNMGPDNYAAFMMSEWRSGGLRMRDFTSASGALLDPSNPKDVARVMEILVGTDQKPGAYKNITTGGDAGIEPGVLEKESLADRYNRRRVFEWANYDSYSRFQETLGYGMDNLGDQFLKHIQQMAHDLGTAKVLGGDPDRAVDTLIQYAKSKDMKKGAIFDNEATLRATWFHASGRASQAASVGLANIASTGRLWLTGALLPNAFLGSLPDHAFIKSGASFNGLAYTKHLGVYLKDMVGDRRGSMQHGLINESGIRGLRDHFDDIAPSNAVGTGLKGESADRFEAATSGIQRIAGQAAEFVMRGTFLDAHSVGGRNMLGSMFLGTLANHVDHDFASLGKANPRLRGFLERYGIDGADWDLLRTKAREGDNLLLNPAKLAWEGQGRAREAAMRLIGAVDAEASMGVPEGNVATRALLLGETRRGTLAGEFLRSIQFKGFTLSVAMMHGWRAFDQMFDKSGAMPRGQYVANLVIMATLLGAASYQLKNIAQGKDPESMDSGDFWAKAFVQGGAGGIMGDYLKTLMQTQSKADAARLLTPTAGLMLDTAALTGGNLAQFIHGQPTNAGREGSNYLKKYLLPRLWYTNLGFDRLIWDNLQRWADPDAAGAFYRTEQRARKQDDVSFWYRPGQMTPSRPPDATAAVKERGLVRSLKELAP